MISPQGMSLALFKTLKSAAGCAPVAQGVKLRLCVIQVPACDGSVHKVTVALIACPLGSLLNVPLVAKPESPGSRSSYPPADVQPFQSSNFSAEKLFVSDVTVSVTEMVYDWNIAPPVLVIWNSINQPAQVSTLLYATVNVGAGVGVGEGVGVNVGVGGGVNTGSEPVSPVVEAYCPHSQQNSPGRSGLRTYQYRPLGSRATISVCSPTSSAPTSL
ncbi:MAG: hypothetical protein D6803_01850 [Anaerolineae bacterium]|nr:MAG: hypothetical protein D6803_01850 [Anaerolineae bacterium]